MCKKILKNKKFRNQTIKLIKTYNYYIINNSNNNKFKLKINIIWHNCNINNNKDKYYKIINIVMILITNNIINQRQIIVG